ncbi:hypothetical protein [Mesorhizobium sp. M8A.F.Ca.ET.021.01.1.1]|uniref:hypothetical protein n=1 Tax=Mesorhizobium sp. M8A.F.Ca.ET.021.01.1.1 TaxID=2496757 RepID=UPI000FC9A115|nr:hypothetical protein [Mesorhizobium sp. M8A.F.Ca.ET.021.01.1.1]RUW53748.1 hypothetical protein EOA36_10190 [Mesorhizobium sp. M8A.F.Ca.ET.021.01.1.1]
MSDIEALRRRLAAALVAEGDDNDTPERARVRKGLGAVLDFLRDADIDVSLRADLHRLYAALEDISQGRTNALLEPAGMQPGTPKKKSFDANHETMAAAAVTILKNDGWKLDDALGYVSAALRLDRGALADYRKNLTSRKIRGIHADSYAQWLNDRKAYPHRSAVEHVAVMIEIGKKFTPAKV